VKTYLVIGLTVGFFIGLPWLVLNYAGHIIAGFALIPFEFFDLLARSLPGGIITIAIEWLIQIVSLLDIGQTSAVGKTIEMALAYLLTLGILSGLGGLYAISLQRLQVNWILRGTIAGLLLSALTSLIVNWGGWGSLGLMLGITWLSFISLIWGICLAWGVDRYQLAINDPVDSSRLFFLGKLALGSITVSGIFVALGRCLLPEPENPPVSVDIATPEPTKPLPTPPPTRPGFHPVPGTRPEITPIEVFYRVDKNLLPPSDTDFPDISDPLVQSLLNQSGNTDLPADSYVLILDGLLEKSLALTLADLKAFPMVELYATMECISNPVGGDLISTTLFQGARLKDILETAGLMPGVIDIKFTCADGYSESLLLESALHPDTILCYAMGNQPLSQEHGSPVRLFTPNRFGLKNPKWIITIEAVDEDYLGFWQRRRWSESAFVKTTSVIDAYHTRTAGQVLVGGIAFSGARGIQAVELRVDEGPWLPAEIDRPLSPLTWVLWRASITLPAGEYTLSVRATDSNGQVQTGKLSRTHPSGATGYHTMKITV
jgi:hypothetical protein